MASDKNNTKKFNLLVVRTTTDGRMVNAKPCKFCIDYIRRTGLIRIIFYTNDQGEIVKEHIDDIESDHLSNIVKEFIRNGGELHHLYKPKNRLIFN